MSLFQIDWKKGGGLAPAIVQHADTGEVLMLGYMNAKALDETQTRGLVTFWSRSKERLWTKGESSGNTLSLVSVATDCDQTPFWCARARPVRPVTPAAIAVLARRRARRSAFWGSSST
mgnify:CR=1 FL=1